MAIEKKAKETAPAPSDKQKALETAISQIEKQFGKGAVMRLGQNATMNVEAIPTGSLSLDMALGIGGLPRGRIVEIYGPESSGKTTVALHVVAEAQKRGGSAVFIDVEHAVPARWMSWSSTRWPRWSPRPRSRAKWAIPMSACRPD